MNKKFNKVILRKLGPNNKYQKWSPRKSFLAYKRTKIAATV